MGINTEKWKNRWSTNEIIVLVLLSLGMQIGLIVFAPLRKRSKNPVLKLMLWLLYLTADSVAILALGNISNQAEPDESAVDNGTMPAKLTVLWAPFLLVHLGGPDSITSYSVEDNELWWRHLLGLVVQIVVTIYLFWQSPPKGLMLIPTMLVFIPGLIKFAERTHALRLGSKDYLKDKIISDFTLGKENKGKVINDSVRGDSKGETNGAPATETAPQQQNAAPATETEDESKRIYEGYLWFNQFKRLLVDVTFESNLLMESQDYFSEMDAKNALEMVAIELSFMYDILHTKAVHMHNNGGRVLRCFSLFSIIAALIVFLHVVDRPKYHSKDIIITYILFGAGLILEVIAGVFLISSDWAVVSLRKKGWRECIARAITSMVKKITGRKGKSRWSRNIGQFSLVGLCLRDRYTHNPRSWIMKKVTKIIVKIKDKWDNMRESRSIPLEQGLLEDIMYTEAKRRAQNVHIYNVLLEARSYRGNKTLERHNQLKTLDWSMKREFDESIILWHVATDICFYDDGTSKKHNGEKQKPSRQPNGENQEASDPLSGENQEASDPPSGENQEAPDPPSAENQEASDQPNGRNEELSNQPIPERDVSCMTSNYLIYLLTQQQSMMQLGYGKTRFEATCAVVKKKFKKIFKAEGKLDPKKARNVLKNEGATMNEGDAKNEGATMNEGAAKNEEATQVSEQSNPLVSADGSPPTNKMGILTKIWKKLGEWGKRKREQDQLKREDEDKRGESVLKDCRRLAAELQQIKPEIKRWQLISEVWMEMLGYAAIHCDSYQHAKSLRRGGELLTHLWLLMSQLGVVDEHKVQQYQSASV